MKYRSLKTIVFSSFHNISLTFVLISRHFLHVTHSVTIVLKLVFSNFLCNLRSVTQNTNIGMQNVNIKRVYTPILVLFVTTDFY